MNTNTGLIFKVFLISIALSLAIKYGGPFLSIPPTNFNALIAVFSPTIILATILGWRAFQQQ